VAPVERPGWRPFRLPGRAVGGWYAELVGRLLRYNNVSLQDMFTLNLQMVNQRFIGWIERNVAQDIMFSPELSLGSNSRAITSLLLSALSCAGSNNIPGLSRIHVETSFPGR
jgi:hypothetical protein